MNTLREYYDFLKLFVQNTNQRILANFSLLFLLPLLICVIISTNTDNAILTKVENTNKFYLIEKDYPNGNTAYTYAIKPDAEIFVSKSGGTPVKTKASELKSKIGVIKNGKDWNKLRNGAITISGVGYHDLKGTLDTAYNSICNDTTCSDTINGFGLFHAYMIKGSLSYSDDGIESGTFFKVLLLSIIPIGLFIYFPFSILLFGYFHYSYLLYVGRRKNMFKYDSIPGSKWYFRALWITLFSYIVFAIPLFANVSRFDYGMGIAYLLSFIGIVSVIVYLFSERFNKLIKRDLSIDSNQNIQTIGGNSLVGKFYDNLLNFYREYENNANKAKITVKEYDMELVKNMDIFPMEFGVSENNDSLSEIKEIVENNEMDTRGFVSVGYHEYLGDLKKLYPDNEVIAIYESEIGLSRKEIKNGMDMVLKHLKTEDSVISVGTYRNFDLSGALT